MSIRIIRSKFDGSFQFAGRVLLLVCLPKRLPRVVLNLITDVRKRDEHPHYSEQVRWLVSVRGSSSLARVSSAQVSLWRTLCVYSCA